ncbi:hypothetical protein ABK040_008662 [Willaertia magna]
MRLQQEITNNPLYRYLLFLPKSYETQTTKQFPLIIFLHGAGEIGTKLGKIKKNGIPNIVERDENEDFPFITVSPQCSSYGWEPRQLSKFLTNIENTYRINKNKIYLTGISMGGFGTFDWLCYEPNRFAAAIPICGGLDPNKAIKIKNVPIWNFHGALDDIIPQRYSDIIIKALRGLKNVNIQFIQMQIMIVGLKLMTIQKFMIGYYNMNWIILYNNK